MGVVPWPAAGSLLAGGGTLLLLSYLRQHRGKPGANWLLLALVAQALWCFSYGVSLLVFDPAVRWVFEALTWTGIVWTGVPFLAFGLEYTGRGSLVRTPWFGAVLLVPVITTLLVLTNPLHELVWSGLRLDPVYGAATVSYEPNAWAFFAIVTGTVFAASGTLLLFDTVVSYGPLYRTEALAVGLSTLPPGVALLVWLFGIGPVPQLNLSAVMFLPHVVLDAYAFVGGGMFTYSPAVRRTADQSAVEDLENPFLVVDTDRRIVDCNPAAESLFDITESAILGAPLADATGLTIDGADARVLTDADRNDHRELAVSTSRLRNEAGRIVGHTVILQDITEQQRREQRLEILNRVLRHNLRNDLTAVRGYLGIAADRVDDDELAAMLEGIHDDVDGVLETSEKARDFERAIESTGRSPSPLAARDTLRSLAAALETELEGRVDVVVPDDLAVQANEQLFELAFENLVENGLVHTDADEPRVTVGFEERGDRTAVFTVSDDGPGIPAHELAVLERGEETALEHGSGLGLWVVSWSVGVLGGDLSFETGESGTTATVRLPESVVPAATAAEMSKPEQSAERPP
ncbi:histidine kinase N-terminal 7TM domain-containing protein [Natrinema salaciae]|uniref:Signal transduction histidine kinase n=1 Tax=Natrinema salaciae TaxID=1186196 RepID=A0A1H9RGL1_9EURY|nr:histidine kinase N-terminal 7TM domain-containing protein [Natrinema salaciae]SER71804.1 Signal transduction histidine kinase [Natrinema salaciae]